MKKLFTILGFFLVHVFISPSFACTNLIITSGASQNKAVYVAYVNDGEWLNHLDKTASAKHSKHSRIPFTSLNGGKYEIPQARKTIGTMGFIANEAGLVIGETTFIGRVELWNKDNPIKYWELMELTLQRAKSAREAIHIMDELCNEYGYGSEGECFSIADNQEAWIMNLIGKGAGEKGAVWVAMKVPDGYISAMGNYARISSFPLDDPENCLYAADVISFAESKAYYNAQSDGPFEYNAAYNPVSPEILRYSATRVWSVFCRANSQLELDTAYHRGNTEAKAYPLWIKPDHPLSFEEIKSLIRDHYEGTAFDMRKGVEAGPFGTPNRVDPTTYDTIGNYGYNWERPISTYKTCFTFISELRKDVPDFLQAKIWYGVDDTYSNVFIPIYIQTQASPMAFHIGDINYFDPQVAWWAFNFVSNYANLRYSCMIEDIRKQQKQTEAWVYEQNELTEKVVMSWPKEKALSTLFKHSEYLTNKVLDDWDQLGKLLIMKYNDGYRKDSNKQIQIKPYSQNWLKTVNKLEPNRHKYPIR